MAQEGQPIQRCSTLLDADNQASAIPNFDSLPKLALAAIHDTLLHGSNDDGGFCEQPAIKDAACFRSTCKAFYDAAIIPPILKLAFVSPSQQTMDSLALMLSKPMVDHTQLSLQLCMERNEPCLDYIAVCNCLTDQPWALPLAAVAQRVVRLEMPSLLVNPTLSAAVRALPGLRELVLHVGKFTETGALHLSDTNSSDEEGDDVPAWLNLSQLQTLTLTVPPGKPPFRFVPSEEQPPLDLEGLPNFKHLVLRGPIVKAGFGDNGSLPFLLPPHAKVTIDSGLGGRKPTPWARPLTVYERFDALPGSAIPHISEYQEEDHEAYQAGIYGKFRTRVREKALKQAPLIDDTAGFCLDGYLEGLLEVLMRLEGIEGRPSLLPLNLKVKDVAEMLIMGFQQFKEDAPVGGSDY